MNSWLLGDEDDEYDWYWILVHEDGRSMYE